MISVMSSLTTYECIYLLPPLMICLCFYPFLRWRNLPSKHSFAMFRQFVPRRGREVEEDSPWCWVQINTGRQTDMRDIKNDLYYSHGCLAHLARKAAEI